jgi:hypothetical protein
MKKKLRRSCTELYATPRKLVGRGGTAPRIVLGTRRRYINSFTPQSLYTGKKKDKNILNFGLWDKN